MGFLRAWAVGRGAYPGYLARRKRMSEETPSEREIGRAVGLKSLQPVHHLAEREAAGYVERTTSPGGTYGAHDEEAATRTTQKGWGVVGTAPLLGRIAAGRGLEAVVVDEAYSLGGELLLPRSGRRRYLLRVVGDSMIGSHIADGDLLVVEEDETPPDGEVVVALSGGEEATVKRLRREGETVRFEPRNGEHEDIVVPAGEVAVQGRVVWVIHLPRASPRTSSLPRREALPPPTMAGSSGGRMTRPDLFVLRAALLTSLACIRLFPSLDAVCRRGFVRV